MGQETPMVVHPASGSRQLRKSASIGLEDGAFVATDRRGRRRRFPIDGGENSPRGFRSADGVFYLEDRSGRALIRFDTLDWDWQQVGPVQEAAGFDVLTEPGTPSPNPEMMKIQDPPYFARASASAAVGTAAVSLYWLHFAPEAVMLLVALPALILFLWFITLTKLAMPKREDMEAAAKHVHEARLRLDAEEAQAAEAASARRDAEADEPGDS